MEIGVVQGDHLKGRIPVQLTLSIEAVEHMINVMIKEEIINVLVIKSS